MNESGKKESELCPEFQKCLKVLYLMLDDEASKEEEAYLTKHVDKCMFCFEQYEVEKQIRELLKTRIAKMPVPADLAINIKNKISQLT
ncbi:MAG: anti-sigma factor (TIGR02949 family) [Cyclobacteriaceae bacterium]|jgi:anti-sigma factor (TIGR02949 family)